MIIAFMKNLSVFVFLCCLLICEVVPQCPRKGAVRLADSQNNRRYLQCNAGRGRWYLCPSNQAFVEKQQKCVPQTSSTSTQRSSRSYNGRGINSNSNNGGSSGGTNGEGVAFDYHW